MTGLGIHYKDNKIKILAKTEINKNVSDIDIAKPSLEPSLSESEVAGKNNFKCMPVILSKTHRWEGRSLINN